MLVVFLLVKQSAVAVLDFSPCRSFLSLRPPRFSHTSSLSGRLGTKDEVLLTRGNADNAAAV